MCIICDKIYDDNTKELVCCSDVTEIPGLPKLERLWCFNTKITKIPFLPKLEYLDCHNTKITEIPILPKLVYLYCYNTNIKKIALLPKLEYLECYDTNITEVPLLLGLRYLHCSNTKITTFPKMPTCFIVADNCVWLNPSAERINRLVRLQKWARSTINKRAKIIHAALHTHRDLVYVLNV